MSIAMEIPEPPVMTSCARCGYQKLLTSPCRRCGGMANRPKPLEQAWEITKGLAVLVGILAFCIGSWVGLVWLLLWLGLA